MNGYIPIYHVIHPYEAYINRQCEGYSIQSYILCHDLTYDTIDACQMLNDLVLPIKYDKRFYTQLLEGDKFRGRTMILSSQLLYKYGATKSMISNNVPLTTSFINDTRNDSIISQPSLPTTFPPCGTMTLSLPSSLSSQSSTSIVSLPVSIHPSLLFPSSRDLISHCYTSERHANDSNDNNTPYINPSPSYNTYEWVYTDHYKSYLYLPEYLSIPSSSSPSSLSYNYPILASTYHCPLLSRSSLQYISPPTLPVLTLDTTQSSSSQDDAPSLSSKSLALTPSSHRPTLLLSTYHQIIGTFVFRPDEGSLLSTIVSYLKYTSLWYKSYFISLPPLYSPFTSYNHQSSPLPSSLSNKNPNNNLNNTTTPDTQTNTHTKTTKSIVSTYYTDYTTYIPYNIPIQSYYTIYLCTLSLPPQLRHHKLGIILLYHAIEYAILYYNPVYIRLHCISYNIPAIMLYNLFGFIIIDTMPQYYMRGLEKSGIIISNNNSSTTHLPQRQQQWKQPQQQQTLDIENQSSSYSNSLLQSYISRFGYNPLNNTNNIQNDNNNNNIATITTDTTTTTTTTTPTTSAHLNTSIYSIGDAYHMSLDIQVYMQTKRDIIFNMICDYINK